MPCFLFYLVWTVIYFCFRLFGLSGIVILSWPCLLYTSFYRPPGNGAGQTGAGKHRSWYGLHREPYRGTGACLLYTSTDRRDFFDLAIGNVPFGQYQVNDKAYNKLNFSIHNYFFAKALATILA